MANTVATIATTTAIGDPHGASNASAVTAHTVRKPLRPSTETASTLPVTIEPAVADEATMRGTTPFARSATMLRAANETVKNKNMIDIDTPKNAAASTWPPPGGSTATAVSNESTTPPRSLGVTVVPSDSAVAAASRRVSMPIAKRRATDVAMPPEMAPSGSRNTMSSAGAPLVTASPKPAGIRIAAFT